MTRRRYMEKLIRPDLARAGAYTPIRPLDVLSERSGVPLSEVIKLDGNENPYGCSPRVQRALAAYGCYHIYPDPEQQELRLALQKYVGVGAEYIVAGAGSDELIDLVLRLLLDPGDEVVSCPPTFGMYQFSTGVCAGKVIDVPRGEGFAVDVAAVKRAITPRTKAVFLASPNNPTGNVVPESTIRELLRLGIAVIVDEAYFEFSGVTVVPLVAEHDNLVVLRTFSKWAGLAGLRVGYGVFQPQLVAHLMKIKQPYNISSAAQVAALESLADLDYLRGTVGALVRERERLFSLLQRLDFLCPYPSQANFVLCRVTNGRAKEIHQGLQRRGIFLRYFDTPLLRDCIRISVGRPEHSDALMRALGEMEREP